MFTPICIYLKVCNLNMLSCKCIFFLILCEIRMYIVYLITEDAFSNIEWFPISIKARQGFRKVVNAPKGRMEIMSNSLKGQCHEKNTTHFIKAINFL